MNPSERVIWSEAFDNIREREEKKAMELSVIRRYIITRDGTFIACDDYKEIVLTERQADDLDNNYSDSERYVRALIYNAENRIKLEKEQLVSLHKALDDES